VALDVAARRADASLSLPFARVAAVPAPLAVGAVVAVSFVVRLAAALAHALPLYFPDEYIYGSLARSIASSGRPLIRGASAHFPAMLEPLLAAPFWLLGDPELAYRLTQGLNALAMSLAAVPVYLLARRLGLSQWVGVGAAVVAVASPDLLYASFVLADPIAYPLVLTAVYLGVRALDRPTGRAQAAFVVVSGLAAFARIQYVVLPVAFACAAVLLERGRVRRYWPTLALLLAPLPVALALGPTRLLGYYSQVGHDHVPLASALKWAATDTMMLAYSAGWVLVPGAVVGLVYALVRPRLRAERAFAALTFFLAGGIFVEAAIYAARGSSRYQERYLFTLVPLVALGFCLYTARGWPGRAAVAVLSTAMLALALRVPLSGFTVADNKQDSPFLFAVFRLEEWLGVDNGSLAVALVAAGLSVAAAAFALARRGTLVALCLTALVAATASAGAFAFDRGNASRVAKSALPAGRDWVDRTGLRHVTFVQTQGAQRGYALEQLFWNRSVDRVALLFGGAPVDAFGAAVLNPTRDGRLVAGRDDVLRGPLLIDTFAARIQLRDATEAARAGTFRLFRPVGTPRLSVLASGLYWDGWLAREGVIRVWPNESDRVRGTLTLRLSLPEEGQATPMRLRAEGIDRRVVVRPGRTTVVRLRAAVAGPWALHFSTSQTGTLGDGRPVSVKSAEPVFSRS
jgi:hypothetical protein